MSDLLTYLKDISSYLLSQSVPAGILIAVVILLRLVFRDVSKSFRGILWALVAARLLCPPIWESRFNLAPNWQDFFTDTAVINNVETAPSEEAATLEVNELYILNEELNNKPITDYNTEYFETYDEPIINSTATDNHSTIFSIIWLVGVLSMFSYSLYQYFKIKRLISVSLPIKNNYFICDNISSSFIFGVLRPKIYMPSSIEENHYEYILAHENAHLKRKDHCYKFLGWILLCFYWFHPLVWIAYSLFCCDTELACDEQVIKDMTAEKRAVYSETLLYCGLHQDKRKVFVHPLAFGEVGIKERVSAILRYKKPAVWLTVSAAVICIALGLCFLTTPKKNENQNMIETVAVADIMELADVEEVAAENIAENIAENTADNINVPTNLLDIAIRKAIIDNNHYKYAPGELDLVSYIILSEETGTSENVITFYLMVFYGQYDFYGYYLEEVSGFSAPIALTFQIDPIIENWSLIEYWEPRDGEYYATDIKNKFPSSLSKAELDTQTYVLQAMQDCYSQAIKYWNIDTAPLIYDLFSEIMSSPALSSNPSDYIEAHPLEVRELMYYGDYTRQYINQYLLISRDMGLREHLMQLILGELDEAQKKAEKYKQPAEVSDYSDAVYSQENTDIVHQKNVALYKVINWNKIVRATLTYTEEHNSSLNLQPGTYTISDPDQLDMLTKFLLSVDFIQGVPACPFNATLVLTDSTGRSAEIRMATDSCATLCIGEDYYNYGYAFNSSDNSIFYSFFQDN